MLCLAYTGLVEVVLIVFPHGIGKLFAADPAVLAEIDRRSLGDVRRAAILALSQTHVFALRMIFVLPRLIGATGIWLASPIADLMLVVVTAVTLRSLSVQRRWGLFATA